MSCQVISDPELRVLLLSNFWEWINLLWASLALRVWQDCFLCSFV